MEIHLIDDLGPEPTAMLQALYSRSAASVTEHLKKVEERGADKFMASYYVGYGHQSIGDCGSTTLFIEGVSLLAAKAIQDNPLYSGQETSTRYIDFANQKVIDPLRNGHLAEMQERWIAFYLLVRDTMIPILRDRHPRKDGQDEAQWEKAISARAFDIARAFLPAGVTTQLSWATNLRQAADNLRLLKYHPLPEVREIAYDCLEQLNKKYPSSFPYKNENLEQQRYLTRTMAELTYRDSIPGMSADSDFHMYSWPSFVQTIRNDPILTQRPRGVQLPRQYAEHGTFDMRFMLDFGSFRDLQRHRNGHCTMPLLTTKYGFHKWYLEQLPSWLQAQAISLLNELTLTIQHAVIPNVVTGDRRTPEEYARLLQYYLPIGLLVPCRLVWTLPPLIYLAELRSSKTVHPTLRPIAHNVASSLRGLLPGIAIHADMDPGDFDIKRGAQDITEKQ